MSKEAAWSRFMASPSAEALAANATLQYITSLYTVEGAASVVSHLNTTRKQTRNWKEATLKARETSSELILEAELSAELDFDGQKNPWLPGLESNMFSGKKIHCVVVYFISFVEDKISSVRLYWDQANLLRQVEAIGSQGRRWPIAEGSATVQLVKRALSGSTEQAPSQGQSAVPTTAVPASHGKPPAQKAPDSEYTPAIASHGPPQAQYDFLAPQSQGNPSTSQARSSGPAQRSVSSEHTPVVATNGPPQAQYDFLAPQSLAENGNIHGRAYNQGRRGQPAPQMNVSQGESAPALAAGSVVGSKGPPRPSYDFLRGE
ncbi:hypothetical protein BCR37DRAFT_392907 [Protomyces lactucae-debilis]|uniref:Uncharacterized protein n=1 Tax=Protomyces lactucae-debilis TaxID=2754530 RepID=A0A1Y2FHH2_PROLT|nr:uncharacterized protein BCR37DRAFT_392907 [Protomyces lactucae-debilis]ORY82706.1 hypothetical protein BCR37DRAFT_392907 [Protomyces lactucae-debilis]